MSDLQVLILLSLGIAVGAYLPRFSRWLGRRIDQYRYRPHLVRRHSITQPKNTPSDSPDA